MMKQGNLPIEEFNTNFCITAAKARVNDDTQLIKYYKHAINKDISFRLVTCDTPPITIDQWYTQACNYDDQLRRAKLEFGGLLPHTGLPNRTRPVI
jgi:hypothetical protein